MFLTTNQILLPRSRWVYNESLGESLRFFDISSVTHSKFWDEGQQREVRLTSLNLAIMTAARPWPTKYSIIIYNINKKNWQVVFGGVLGFKSSDLMVSLAKCCCFFLNILSWTNLKYLQQSWKNRKMGGNDAHSFVRRLLQGIMRFIVLLSSDPVPCLSKVPQLRGAGGWRLGGTVGGDVYLFYHQIKTDNKIWRCWHVLVFKPTHLRIAIVLRKWSLNAMKSLALKKYQ